MKSGNLLLKNTHLLLAAMLILPSLLIAQQTEGWEKLAPTPPPVTLNDIYMFDENKMVAVGDEGNLLSTSDGGTTWDFQENVLGNTNILRAVDFFNENNGIAIGNAGTSRPLYTTDGGETWNRANSSLGAGIYDVQMLSETLAYAVANQGKVFRTDDGGQSWEKIDTGHSGRFFTLHFFDADNGFVAGCGGISCSNNILYRTSDGGESWEEVDPGVNVQLFDMQFINDDTGYVGSRGRMIKTVDGGMNWEEINLPTTRWVRAIEFFDENEGIAIASPEWAASANVQHNFFRTTDGGETWDEQVINVPGIIEAVHSSGDIMWAVGQDGAILKSNDRGVSWADPVLTRLTISGIESIDRETYIAYTRREILLSTDSGLSWSKIMRPDSEPTIGNLYVFDVDNLIISDGGDVYRTTNGGQTWNQPNNDLARGFRDMVFDSNGTGVGVTSHTIGTNASPSEVYLTTDYGDTWSLVEGVSADRLYSVAFNGDSTFMVVGEQFQNNNWQARAFISEDSGENWTARNNLLDSGIRQVDFADSKHAVITGGTGIAFSSDGAGTWTRADLPDNVGSNSISFLDRGFAIVRSGNSLYTTSNLGEDWEQFDVFPSETLSTLHFVDRLKILGGAAGGTLYRTVKGFGFADSEPASIEIATGDNQEFRVNEPSEPLRVNVIDTGGSAVRGGLVRFSVESVPEGTEDIEFVSLQALSDENGNAEVVILAGGVPGKYTVTASSNGMNNSPLTFTLTVVESGVSNIVTVSGNEQVGFVNSSLESSLIVRATNDDGDGIPQIPINFEITSMPENTSGEGLTVTSAVTDSKGEASTEVMLGIAPGEYVISATSPEIDGVVAEFTVTATSITSDEFTWELLNPSPQANALYGVHAFDANTAVITGEFGTIMKTEDAGETWSTEFLVTGEDIRFTDVTFVGNEGWAVGQNGRIMKSSDGGDNWRPIESGTANELISVTFENAQNGWITGSSGTLLKTTNGGDSWVDISIDTGDFVQSVYFVTENTGFATVSTTTQNVVVSNPIFKTEDGGETWTGLNTSNNYSVYDIQFLNENHGWAASYRGIFRTEDGGKTWDFTQVSNQNMRFFGIHMHDQQSGVSVDDAGRIWTTTDGSSWSVQYNPGGMRFWDLSFSDNNNGFVVGTNGEILSTIDGAESWSQLHSSFTNRTIGDIHFTSEAKGYLVTRNSLIYSTTDAGNSWERFDAAVNTGIGGGAGFTRVHFHGENNGWAVTANGDVLKTVDGSDWEEVEDVITTQSNRTLNAVYTVDENTAFVGGGFGQTIQFKRTTDGGETWDDISSGLDPIRDIFFLDVNTGWVTTQYMVFKTTDGGDNWEVATSFGLSNNFSKIQFFDQERGYVLNGANLMITENGGENWELVEADMPITGNDLHFISPEKGWVGGSRIWSTEDGGETWVANRKQAASDITSVFALSEDNIWIGGDNGLLLRSEEAILTSLNDELITDLPMEYTLEQNYPNPFNPTTVIEFSLPQSTNVRLDVFNVIGQRVATLVNETRQAGVHEVNFDASQLASGAYFYRLDTGNSVMTRSMILIK